MTTAHRPGRLGIGVVGAGRVGAVLAAALRAVGHAVVGASGTSPASEERIATLLPGVPVLSIEDVVERAEVVLLTVPDDVLPELVSGLAELGRWQPGQLVLHTSGRHGTTVLAPAARAGAIGLAIHPAMTFTGTSLDLSRLTGCPFAVTAPATVLPIAQALVVEIGGEPVVLDEAQRPAYHAALTHGASHLVTLVAQAQRVLLSAGVENPGALLTPLLTAALDGALRSGEAQVTGPVPRGDAGTVAAHLAALASSGQGDALATYRQLARVTAQRALAARRLSPPAAQRILAALDAAPADAQDPRMPTTATDAPTPLTTDAPVPVEPVVARTRADVRAALAALPGRRALVMTMGALHDGHLALVREARRRADHVVVSVAVNPLRLAAEDYADYPRDLEGDVALLRAEGVDVVFAPDDTELYRGQPRVRLDPGAAAQALDGCDHPERLAGALHGAAKMLGLVRPDVAVLGRKDAQLLSLVRGLVADLELGVDVVGAPVLRDADGLPLARRTLGLTDAERAHARALPQALAAGRAAADDGATAGAVADAARAVLASADGIRVDDVAVVHPDTFRPADRPGPALLVVAAWVGPVRLTDNTAVQITLAGRA